MRNAIFLALALMTPLVNAQASPATSNPQLVVDLQKLMAQPFPEWGKTFLGHRIKVPKPDPDGKGSEFKKGGLTFFVDCDAKGNIQYCDVSFGKGNIPFEQARAMLGFSDDVKIEPIASAPGKSKVVGLKLPTAGLKKGVKWGARYVFNGFGTELQIEIAP